MAEQMYPFKTLQELNKYRFCSVPVSQIIYNLVLICLVGFQVAVGLCRRLQTNACNIYLTH